MDGRWTGQWGYVFPQVPQAQGGWEGVRAPCTRDLDVEQRPQGKACGCQGGELRPEGRASPSLRGTASTGVSVVSPSDESTAWGAVSSQDALQAQGPPTAALLGRHLLALRC